MVAIKRLVLLGPSQRQLTLISMLSFFTMINNSITMLLLITMISMHIITLLLFDIICESLILSLIVIITYVYH